MAINTFAYAILFQEQLDKQIVAKSTTGWMEGNAGLVRYNGGNTVKIPKISMDGLANYSRTNGFTQGAATLAYETMTMTQDRGRTFALDSQDIDETNFVANASALMSEFQRTMVIPEIDAFRYSKIAQIAIAAGKTRSGYTPSKTDILSQIKADIAAVQDVIGADVPLVITMSTATLAVLESSTELTRQLIVGQFNPGLSIATQVKYVDDCPIMEVPSARLKTNYTFNDGVTAGQTQGGFTPSAAAVTKASLFINDVTYTSVAPGIAGNAYTVTINQSTGASVATAGVVDNNGNLVITLGTDANAKPLTVTAQQIAALAFTGTGAALITATTVMGTTKQGAIVTTNLTGGSTVAAGGRNINWIICPQNAPIAISKTDKIRIFDPNTNQNADAWKLDYRKYHDLWIPDNQMAAVYVNVRESLII